MTAQQTSVGRIGPQKFDDGVVLHGNAPHTKRWQKHGEDRLYFESTKDDGGYVDLTAGEVVDLQPYYGSGVRDYDMGIEGDTVVIRALPEYSLVQKQDAEPQVVAEIPLEVFA